MIDAADSMTLQEPAEADDLRGIAKRRVIDELAPLRAQGKSLEECAAALGHSAATLWRWEKAFKKHGDAGLKTKHGNAGRKRLANLDVFTEEDRAFVKRLTLKSESLPLALERLSDVGNCSPAARDLIDRYRRSGDYPPSFYSFFHVTEAEKELAKGEKHFDGHAYTARRGMWYLDSEGLRRELFAGGLVEADDVSVDCPYYVELPDGTFSVGRQLLCFRDRRSRKWLGAYAVARERDSYRAEDIARAARELCDAWGLPDRFRFERGSWESNVVRGISVEDGRGGEIRWGGFSNVVPVTHVFTSRAKGTIEGGFRMLHKVLGLHGVRIGKHRGEYEQASADMLAINAGTSKKHPRDCGFIAWADLLVVLGKVFTLLNQRPVFFQELNAKRAPDDVWAQDMAARPGGRLPALDPALAWHFLPVKAKVGAAIAQAGHVKVSVPGYPLPFFFRIGGPGVCFVGDGVPAEGIERNLPFLDCGHRVIVAFDPQRAAEGAVIFNAERGPKNTENWRPFQKLFLAPLAGEAPQFNLRPGDARDSEDLAARRSREAQVRSGFNSIGLYGQGARQVRQDHDGRGNVARVETGAPARTRALRVPAAERPRAGVAEPTRARRTAPAIVEDFTEAPPRRGSIPIESAAPVEEW